MSMLWRILFSAVAISYLMCVLFLSGIQKEDLEVSMLTKLQRYNVNIEDMNNEQMNKNCITQDTSKTKISFIENSETTRNPFNNTGIKIENTKAFEQIKDMLNDKYLQETEKKSNRTHNLNMNIPNLEKNYTNTIVYSKGQPNIDSVMKFWKNYASPSGIPVPRDSSIEIHKINTNPTKENTKINLETNSKQSDIINNILKQYDIINQNGFTPTRKINTETRDINFENFKISNIDEQIGHINHPLPLRDKTYEEKSVHKIERNNDSLNNLPEHIDILKIIRQYSNQKQIEEKSKEVTSANKYEPVLYLKPFSQSTFLKNSNIQNIKKESDTNQIVPEDLVKKIAISVKDMVLQELRREFKTTSTTPKAEITSISRKENDVIEDNIMKKLIEMFENVKSQQKHSLSTMGNNKKNYEMGNIKIEERMNKNTHFPLNPPDVILFTPLPYNLQPQIHKYKSDTPPSYLKERKPLSRPITFQTNSLEIPPLGIPITHHQYPINQNIIVTTTGPIKAIQYESDSRPVHSHSASDKLYPKEILQSPLSAKFVKRSDDCPLHHGCNHKNQDIIRFRLSNKGSAKYDTDYYEKINMGKFEPYLDTNKNENSPANRPKFHEKLERADDRYDVFSDVTSDDCCNSKYGMTQRMVECCNEKIASRQQTSIANIKRGSYDDTHFRNFLKTQQKVTDMLERILASKVKPDRPRSVETT